MDTVSFLFESKRSMSKTWLLGLTVRGYATVSLALYCFGGALVSSTQVPAGKGANITFHDSSVLRRLIGLRSNSR